MQGLSEKLNCLPRNAAEESLGDVAAVSFLTIDDDCDGWCCKAVDDIDDAVSEEEDWEHVMMREMRSFDEVNCSEMCDGDENDGRFSKQ